MASANTSSKNVGNLTMDKAAFLLIRIKRAFLRKRNKGRGGVEKPIAKKKNPLLRARTLPAIICPSLNIIQAQLEANNVNASTEGSYLDPERDLSKSPIGSPRPSVTSVTSITSSTSQQSTGKDSTKQRYESTKASLAKLARLLTSKEKTPSSKGFHQFPSAIPNIEVTPLRRSGSVDSLLDASCYQLDSSDKSNCSSMACLAATYSASNLEATGGTLAVPSDGRPFPTSPSVPAKLEAHRRGDIPSSPSVPNKLAKGGSGTLLGSREVLFEGLPLSKTEKKRLEKVNKINIDLQALFVSVEHEHLERARNILTSADVNVNCVNGDGFTPLDIAVMTLNMPMARLLQSYGARETTRFRSKESRFNQLMLLVKEAERYVEDMTSCLLSTASSATFSIALVKEKEKQLNLWKRRQQLLRKMKSGFEKIRTPQPPTSVQLEVVGTKTLKVVFLEPNPGSTAESLVTKYRVEWSCAEDFRSLSGAREIMNLQKLEILITDLTHGVPYYVRVSSGNSKGYSQYVFPTPPRATPSSWMDVKGKKPRCHGRLCQLDYVFHQMIFSRPPYSSEVKEPLFSYAIETPQQQRRQVRKSIKNLFTFTPKFQKTMKRGVYLSCLFYSDHRVLVTTEDTLPIMEIDDSCPSPLHNDFHWLMKVACTWDDVKALRVEMGKTHSSSAVHFRSKLLQAAEQMQIALGIHDLGQFYYKPLKDAEDTTVLCTVRYIEDPKSINSLSVRWIPLAKLQRKLSINSELSSDVSTINNLLLSSTQNMMTYNHLCSIPLPRGLYTAYVKISCSVELIRILVLRNAPNVLPYYRIRENPHVSKEEWEWIKNGADDKSSSPTDAQLKFQKALSSAINNLLTLLEISPEQAVTHRIYDAEVVDLNPEVSLILILPPIECVCSAPGQNDDIVNRDDCLLLPIQIFEMIHMCTYQHTFISRYSRVSSILEMDTIVAHHAHRQAFSSTELTSAQSRIRQLQEFQSRVDQTWRAMRWLMDALNFARQKQPPGGVPVIKILVHEAGSPTSVGPPTPPYSLVRHTLRVPGEFPSLSSDSANPILIKINNSTSSVSLTETTDQYITTSDMRRCASTSGLFQVTTDENLVLSDLGIEDQAKAYSIEGLSLTYRKDSLAGNSLFASMPGEDAPLFFHKEKDAKRGASSGDLKERQTHPKGELDPSDKDIRGDIVINVTGSCRSLSSNEASLPEVEEEDEEDGRGVIQVGVKGMESLNEDSSEDSTDEGGLQFKDLPCATDEEEDRKDIDSFLGLSPPDTKCSLDPQHPTSDAPGMLLVQAAYDSGLPLQTSVRLHVTPDANVREIVDTVVKQVNAANRIKSRRTSTCKSASDLTDFCLVMNIGSRETCLSDNFQPLKFQNPWTKGKLLVRRKSDLCGATSDF